MSSSNSKLFTFMNGGPPRLFIFMIDRGPSRRLFIFMIQVCEKNEFAGRTFCFGHCCLRRPDAHARFVCGRAQRAKILAISDLSTRRAVQQPRAQAQLLLPCHQKDAEMLCVAAVGCWRAAQKPRAAHMRSGGALTAVAGNDCCLRA